MQEIFFLHKNEKSMIHFNDTNNILMKREFVFVIHKFNCVLNKQSYLKKLYIFLTFDKTEIFMGI